jgi:chromate transporter
MDSLKVKSDQLDSSTHKVTTHQLWVVFLKIGLLSFGGPAAQIALMHKMLVQEQKWLNEQQYLNALGFCMLLPGPEAMQLATYAGWRIKGIAGGLIAGLLFVVPGAIVILLFASIYMLYADTLVNNISIVDALFLGVKAAVLIIVFEALKKVSKRALKVHKHWFIAGLAFIAIFFFSIPFPLIVLAAGMYGFVAASDDLNRQLGSQSSPVNKQNFTSIGKLFSIIAIGLFLWLVPIVLIGQLTEYSILHDIAIFFAKLAVVTFGGAYAVLVYMAQDVVTQFGWLSAGEMMDALGLAETTPGPLILVTQFVGFIAAFREGGYWLGVVGALITLWVTFIPCFIWIFAGAPYIEWIHKQQRLSAALSAITAAVVGVILNLSIWFALHVLFSQVTEKSISIGNLTVLKVTLWQPEFNSFDWRVLILASLCAWLLLIKKVNMIWVLMGSSLAGWGLTLLA